MAFLIISESYSNIVMEQLFLFFTELFVLIAVTAFPARAALYLNHLGLLILKLLSGGTSFLLNCHKLLDVSE